MLLKKLGISISPTGLWKWIKKFGDKAYRFLSNIAKSKAWLSIAVDELSRFIIDFLLIFRRKPSRDYIKQFDEIRTDGFKAYVKLAKKLGIKRVRLKFGENQVVERLFRTIKQRLHWLTRFNRLETAKCFLSLWIAFYNFVRYHKGIKKVPCEELGMKRLSSKELIVKIFMVLVFYKVLIDFR